MGKTEVEKETGVLLRSEALILSGLYSENFSKSVIQSKKR